MRVLAASVLAALCAVAVRGGVTPVPSNCDMYVDGTNGVRNTSNPLCGLFTTGAGACSNFQDAIAAIQVRSSGAAVGVAVAHARVWRRCGGGGGGAATAAPRHCIAGPPPPLAAVAPVVVRGVCAHS